MAIVSTTDVVQNIDSTREVAKNGSVVCSCLPTGRSYTIDTNTDSNFVSFDTSLTYAALQTKYTDRYDDISYYNATS